MKRRKTKKTVKKSIKDLSLVKRGKIYCINHKKNKTPYWGGENCGESTPHQNAIVRWVCPACVAKIMPIPSVKKTVAPLPNGEKRKRGRPPGSKNKK